MKNYLFALVLGSFSLLVHAEETRIFDCKAKNNDRRGYGFYLQTVTETTAEPSYRFYEYDRQGAVVEVHTLELAPMAASKDPRVLQIDRYVDTKGGGNLDILTVLSKDENTPQGVTYIAADLTGGGGYRVTTRGLLQLSPLFFDCKFAP